MTSALNSYCRQCGHRTADVASTACITCGSTDFASTRRPAASRRVLRLLFGGAVGALVAVLCLILAALNVLDGFKGPGQSSHFILIAYAPILLLDSQRLDLMWLFPGLGCVLTVLQFPAYGMAMAWPASARRRAHVAAWILAAHVAAVVLVLGF